MAASKKAAPPAKAKKPKHGGAESDHGDTNGGVVITITIGPLLKWALKKM